MLDEAGDVVDEEGADEKPLWLLLGVDAKVGLGAGTGAGEDADDVVVEEKELTAAVAMAAAARPTGLRGGNGEASELGFGGGDGAGVRPPMAPRGGGGTRGTLWTGCWTDADGKDEGRITVERLDGGTGGGGGLLVELLEEELESMVDRLID